jgi:DNA-binding GntR family transcriptional regulator
MSTPLSQPLLIDDAEPAAKSVNVTQVRDRLRAAVLRSRLRPGTLHSQGDVRTLLDVGRTPFREALRMVQAEGLIEIRSNGQLRIPELSIDDFTQVQIVRIALESAAMRMSIPRLGPDDLAHLEGLMAQMSHYISFEHFDRMEHPHLEFHRALAAGAGSGLLGAISDLTDRIARYRWANPTVVQSHWEARTKEHRAILDAAIAGDPERVVAHLIRHYLGSGRRLVEAMGMPDGPRGHEWFEEQILGSLAPSVREGVLELS